MKKTPLLFLLVLVSFWSQAQTSVQVNTATIGTGCSVTLQFHAYTSTCRDLNIQSIPVVVGKGFYTFSTTSSIWPTPPPPGAQIKWVTVTDQCSNIHGIGEICANFPATITLSCGTCFTSTNNCNWSYTGGSTATLTITP